MKSFRHGDVIIVSTEETMNLDDMNRVENGVVAEGEVTGHAHRVEGDAEVWRDMESGLMKMLVGEGGATITHEEHGTHPIPQGTYDVTIKRQYRPGGWDRVQD